MARVRVKLQARTGSGAVVADPAANASLFCYDRGTDVEANLYAATSGGSPLTQPIAATAGSGLYAAWIEKPGQYDLVEVLSGTRMPPIAWEARTGALGIEGWIAPTLLNSWVNFGGAFNSAGYCQTQEGLVLIRGLVKSGTVGSPIFVLPVGYRPAFVPLYFPVLSNNGVGRIDIQPDGDVIATENSNNLWVSLDGITFPAEQ